MQDYLVENLKRKQNFLTLIFNTVNISNEINMSGEYLRAFTMIFK